jgi:hypothetical protein
MTTQTNNQWTRMLGSYATSREAIDQVRKLEQDRYRRKEYIVTLDKESGRYYIEFRPRI